ncbi:MbcA/ParS/Xre antitoxin family protein [Marinobacter sp. F4206]|uniref:MbcA/ParS/Xre antitoxin family protein n=1 Tax=Marinobacter sp. F4206 TaxID=2861777 RepID=UPI001C5F0B00|nr:MbcA/ParS/Xre antitoxin family protein [Marinobacter sp. F4206]MBW4933069.1 MbcA/ParS/Xre antitoxin family protein [Marinobacter sp. F4206]
MSTVKVPNESTQDKALLSKALINAGKAFGFNQTELAEIVGRNRTGLVRDGIDPDSKAGELALLFIRLYRSVYALTGGEAEAMKHWINTENRYFEAIPRQLIRSAEGLVRVNYYLDAMRGKL